MRGNQFDRRIAIEYPAINNPRYRQGAVGGPEELLVQRVLVPIGLAWRIGWVKKQRFAACLERVPERLEFRLIEVSSGEIGREDHAMHVETMITTFELADAIIEVDHRQPGECFEASRVLGVSFGECIVDNSAQLQRFAPVAAFFDAAAGI